MPTALQARKWAKAQALDTTRLLERQPRARVVHGWAFRSHSESVSNQIKLYLLTGKRDDLPAEYRGMFDGIMRDVLSGTFR